MWAISRSQFTRSDVSTPADLDRFRLLHVPVPAYSQRNQPGFDYMPRLVTGLPGYATEYVRKYGGGWHWINNGKAGDPRISRG